MAKTLPGPVYHIKTRRLTLRCWAPTDAPRLEQAIASSLEHLRPWMPWARSQSQDLDAQVALLRRFRGDFDHGRDFHYGVFDRDDRELYGGTGLHTSAGEGARAIGYWLRADQTGKLLATELAAALTQVAFRVDGVRRVEIHCDPLNVRSVEVARRLGFTCEGTLRQRLPGPDGTRRDEMIWTLHEEEYPSSPAASAEIEAYDALGRRVL
ncbi:GNAT family N-acetyltransferase [Sorangium sp. So ce1182]|uniref:GNAT family N-acetyltransferase n=1 Tax=Sorangium sp. So ce1182 TaxID=3133334 RepID=UPI003F5DD1BF